MDVRDLTGRWVLVTGAASGIGRASALAFAGRGAHLALCDLDTSGLEETAAAARTEGRAVLTQRVDVSDADGMEGFATLVHGHCDAVDIVMNNAGVAIGARFQDTPLEDWRWILDINVLGVVHGCRTFVPRMVARGTGGHVVNVASAAGLLATQMLSAYATTKFAVVGLSEALRDELADDGIGVTAICPGIIDTPITRAARLYGSAAAPAERERMVQAYRRRNYTPERVAEAVLRAVQRNRAVAPIAAEAWVMYWMKRFAPRLTGWLVHRASVRGRSGGAS